ncbi:MAG: PAS domain S-box protein [Planctomycetota bacterium]|nr:MAG: PAS domain S-box protein [Planctomycetota bacterium]
MPWHSCQPYDDGIGPAGRNMSHSEEEFQRLITENAALRKINQALMGRVESTLDQAEGTYALFERTVMLEDAVRQRTQDLEASQDRLQEMLLEQVQAKEAVSERELLLRQLTEAMKEVFWLRSADNQQMLYVNQAYESVFGRSCQSLYDEPFSFLDCIIEDDRPRIHQAFTQYLHTHTFHEHYRISQPGGDIRWLSVRAFPVYDDQRRIIRHAGIASDITQRKLAEEQLRLLNRAIMQSSAAMVITDITGTITTINQAAETITGYPKEMLIGANPRILKSDRTPPEVYQDLWTTITQGKIWRGEFLNRRRDGSLYWESDTIGPVRDDQGIITHFVAIKEDITAHKAMIADLQQAKIQAEAANQAKSEFLANMSHEIRTPMNGVMGMAEILLDSKLNGQQQDWVRTIIDSAQSQLSIVNDILEFSRLESGKMPIERQRYNLHALMHQVAQPYLIRLNGQATDLLVYTPASLPQWHWGDPARVRQILANLLDNAVKFTESGFIVLSAQHNHRHLMLRVEDSGIGIPQHRQVALFKPFEQADNSTSRRYGGSGLGLAICKRLSEAMNGEIILESQEGQGSTITLLLPLDIHPQQDPGRPFDQPLALSGQHFYLISDLPRSAAVLSTLIQEEGGKLLTSPVIASATAPASMDWQQPGTVLLDGDADFCRAHSQLLRQHNNSPGPCCWLARNDNPEHKQSATQCGCQAYLAWTHYRNELIPLLARLAQHTQSHIHTRSQLRKDTRQAPSVDSTKPLRDKRVLIAEDNAVNQVVITAMVKGLGCKDPILANDGQEAVDAYCHQPPDLVLMDVQMPELDGLQATIAIRAWEAEHQTTHTPIIAITANAMQGDRERCLASGMDGYLSKPVRKAALSALLRTLLEP